MKLLGMDRLLKSPADRGHRQLSAKFPLYELAKFEGGDAGNVECAGYSGEKRRNAAKERCTKFFLAAQELKNSVACLWLDYPSMRTGYHCVLNELSFSSDSA